MPIQSTRLTWTTFAAACSVLGACAPALPPPPPAPPALSSTQAPANAKADYVDPNESAAPIPLQPLFTEGHRLPFPPKRVGDIGCLGSAKTTGDDEADYASLVSACGAPTGMAPYTRPVSGKLHGVLDKSDAYALRLAGGYCYRVFGASDQSVLDLDVRVRTASGAAIAQDTTAAPQAIVGGDEPFCIASTGDYLIEVAVDGLGFGSYTVGVWARPAP